MKRMVACLIGLVFLCGGISEAQNYIEGWDIDFKVDQDNPEYFLDPNSTDVVGVEWTIEYDDDPSMTPRGCLPALFQTVKREHIIWVDSEELGQPQEPVSVFPQEAELIDVAEGWLTGDGEIMLGGVMPYPCPNPLISISITEKLTGEFGPMDPNAYDMAIYEELYQTATHHYLMGPPQPSDLPTVYLTQAERDAIINAGPPGGN